MSTFSRNPQTVLGGIFGVIGIGCLALGGWLAFQSYQLLRHGIHTTGTVLQVVRHTGTRSSPTYSPLFEFTSQDQKTRQVESKTATNPPAFEVGERVEVIYPPASPEDAKIVSVSDLWLAPLIVGIVGAVFFVIGLITALQYIRREQLKKWLRQYGQRIASTYRSVELNYSIRVNKRYPFQILSTWKDPGTGMIHEFRSENFWEDPTPHVQGRTTIDVLIDPADPKRYWMDTSLIS